MGEAKTDVLQGTLDLMVLKTLEALGPLHGYGIARRIEQVSENLLQLNQGTLYPALLRLQQRGWIKTSGAPQRTIAKPSFISSARRPPPTGRGSQKLGTDFRCHGAPAQRAGRLTCFKVFALVRKQVD